MQPSVFLTGASSGIGEAFARHYASTGANLGLVARRGDRLTELAQSLESAHGIQCLVQVADVSDAGAMRHAAERFMARFGTPDIVIANAGVSAGTLGGDSEDLPILENVWRINVLGLAATLQPFVAPMRARGRGTLAGITSIAGLRGFPGSGAYASSKAAAIAWLESLRVELHGSGVSVCTILPGYIATPMTAANRFPMPFLLQADDAARRMARVIARRNAYAIVPWPMAIIGRVLRWLPAPLFDAAFARAPRKSRRTDIAH